MPRYTKSKSPEEAALHKRRFADFCRAELATGGPDQHMRVIVAMCEDVSREEAAWRAGCYLGPYVEATAEAIWQAWPWERFKAERAAFPQWVVDNWAGLSIRQERRPVKSRAKFAVFFEDYATWAEQRLPSLAGETDFEKVWAAVNEVRYVGRYAAMKLCETLRRLGFHDAPQPDIRVQGAWSPRLSLSYLYPEHDEVLNRSVGNRGDAEAQRIAVAAFDELSQGIRFPDVYHFEVLLCDYKQAVDGKYYPARPLDSALTHLTKVGDHFHNRSRLLEVRAGLFGPDYLGELQGWWGRRDDLGDVMNKYGYVWNDRTYDYMGTKDLADPVLKMHAGGGDGLIPTPRSEVTA